MVMTVFLFHPDTVLLGDASQRTAKSVSSGFQAIGSLLRFHEVLFL